MLDLVSAGAKQFAPVVVDQNSHKMGLRVAIWQLKSPVHQRSTFSIGFDLSNFSKFQNKTCGWQI